ncbi:glycerophosphodiester phosphodiesterase family protein [Vibrio sinaloensis]|uniref:glycerophosphodiester phosphodiesterase family protein n=1 Tax=Photobacterium sp. (strain ATCC 43367) TaxID=379097 RepID=UPI00206F3237|nr:glycerophosphodiester phosphodiesterase family protein [Vibrio sinaloensis]UPQ89101.1 glycerophosphoryl diester phosphodiesterase [Vibrio sinaloensis]
MIIVGHRGVAGEYPENTRASILAAIDLGLEWVEVDIQPTRDHQLVVCHDHTIDRCSTGRGRIDEMTLEALKQHDFGSWFSSRFADEKILCLNELLAIAKQHNIKLNLEIKVDRHDPHYVCQLLAQALEQADYPKQQLVLSSFSHEVMRELFTYLPDYSRAVLCERVSQRVIALLAEVEASHCNVNYRWVSKRKVDQLKRLGYQVWAYTVNNPRSLKHLQNLDGIFSDHPQRFL